ncbi:hypothetical protein I350_02616 [Cryptococcus amylolentus CBS 6273]|uniref:Uncharacterized protein n=1 Tax=Cryptococcus amylolentus CBS 6273 TaxID=1296118 RepID=A0A1E3K7G3_9TREE|nr:hypothetical protein I350_02616 [Cryptococcus amylolentus CBS 6273]
MPSAFASLFCRNKASHVDPLPAGYSSRNGALGPTFVPLQPPPDVGLDPDTFREISEAKQKIDLALSHMRLVMSGEGRGRSGGNSDELNRVYNCIRDYSEETLNRWLNTYNDYTAALRQLGQAGKYVEHQQRIASGAWPTPARSLNDSTSRRRAMPLVRQETFATLPDVGQPSEVAQTFGQGYDNPQILPPDYPFFQSPPAAVHASDAPPPVPEKPRSARPMSFQPPPVSKPSTSGIPTKPRPSSWQVAQETSGAFLKAVERLSASESLIPQEYAHLLQRATQQEQPDTSQPVSPTTTQVASADSSLYANGMSATACRGKRTIPRVRPPSRDAPLGEKSSAFQQITKMVSNPDPSAPSTAPASSASSYRDASGSKASDSPSRDTIELAAAPHVNETPSSVKTLKATRAPPTPPSNSTFGQVTPTGTPPKECPVAHPVQHPPPLSPSATANLLTSSVSSSFTDGNSDIRPTSLETTFEESLDPLSRPSKSPARFESRPRAKTLDSPAPQINVNVPSPGLTMRPSEAQESHPTPMQDKAMQYSRPTLLSDAGSAISPHLSATSLKSDPSIHTPLSETEPISPRKHDSGQTESSQRNPNVLTPSSKSFSTYSTPRAGYTTPDGSPVKKSNASRIPRKAELGERQPLEERKANTEPKESVIVMSGNPQSVEVVDGNDSVGGSVK